MKSLIHNRMLIEVQNGSPLDSTAAHCIYGPIITVALIYDGDIIYPLNFMRSIPTPLRTISVDNKHLSNHNKPPNGDHSRSQRGYFGYNFGSRHEIK
jgi:hypothetical protein